MATKVTMDAPAGDRTSTAPEPNNKHMLRANGKPRSEKKAFGYWNQWLKSLRSGQEKKELGQKPKPT